MTLKVNVYDIVRCHFSTLVNDQDRVSKSDLIIFFILPCVLAGWVLYVQVNFTKEVLQTFTGVGALLAALMLNLLVIIFERKTKLEALILANPGTPSILKRQRLTRSLYYNISYTTLVATILAALPLLALQLDTKIWDINFGGIVHHLSPSVDILSPVLIFVLSHIAMTFLMVLKRTFDLLES